MTCTGLCSIICLISLMNAFSWYLTFTFVSCCIFFCFCCCEIYYSKISLCRQEAFEKCWAHSPLRAAAHPNFTLPFTRCRYSRMPPLSHTACASMSTTSTTTRDRGDHYGPIEWAQWAVVNAAVTEMSISVFV